MLPAGPSPVTTATSHVGGLGCSGATVASGVLEAAVTMDDTPAFVRGGYIIARRDRPRRSTAAMHGDPYTLVGPANCYAPCL